MSKHKKHRKAKVALPTCTNGVNVSLRNNFVGLYVHFAALMLYFLNGISATTAAVIVAAVYLFHLITLLQTRVLSTNGSTLVSVVDNRWPKLPKTHLESAQMFTGVYKGLVTFPVLPAFAYLALGPWFSMFTVIFGLYLYHRSPEFNSVVKYFKKVKQWKAKKKGKKSGWFKSNDVPDIEDYVMIYPDIEIAVIPMKYTAILSGTAYKTTMYLYNAMRSLTK